MPQDAPPNGSAPSQGLQRPWSRVAGMQAKLHRWAAADAGRRFDDLFNFVHDPATLLVAFDRVAGNQGANTPGVDGITAAWVEEQVGVSGFLDDLRAAIKDGSFRPLPVRERLIPKPGGSGKVRKLGIPTIADRVVQAALKLVLEPIFEADFLSVSYGFRPMRRAQDAIAEIHYFGTRGYRWVLDADIEAAFDNVSHSAVLERVRARVKDKRVLALVRAFLKAGILTDLGEQRDTLTGTPQGGILSPLIFNIDRGRRLLTHFRLAGVFDNLAGLIVGVPVDTDRGDAPDSSWDELILRCAGGAMPVVTNIEFGHTARKIPLPIGGRVDLDLSGTCPILRYQEDLVGPA